jgi:hypothetical protein
VQPIVKSDLQNGPKEGNNRSAEELEEDKKKQRILKLWFAQRCWYSTHCLQI